MGVADLTIRHLPVIEGIWTRCRGRMARGARTGTDARPFLSPHTSRDPVVATTGSRISLLLMLCVIPGTARAQKIRHSGGVQSGGLGAFLLCDLAP
jgi:hypothetical protein